MKDNVTWIRPVLEKMNVNDVWYQGLLIFCKNVSAHYTKVTEKKMTMTEIDQFVDAMKIILCEQNNVTTDKEDGE